MILKQFHPKVLWIGGLGLLLAGGLSMGAYLIYQKYAGPQGHGPTPTKQLWTCSMHPQVLKDEPGQCPICHMDLVPVKQHQSAPGANNEGGKQMTGMATATTGEKLLIRVEPAVVQKLGIQTELVKRIAIKHELRAIAHLEFNEKNQTIINSRVDGWVEKLYAQFTGQTVRRGQALASIYSPQLVSTQEEYLQLYKRLQEVKGTAMEKDTETLVAAARRRLKLWNISSGQIAAIEKTGKVSRTLTLYSPYSGVLVGKHVVQGARVKEGTDLFKIIDLSTVWAFVHIPEKDIPFVKLGMEGEMIVTQIPGKKFKGQVSFIFPYMDPQTRDLKVRVSFANHGFQLRPGMYATLLLQSSLSGKHLVVPMSAVIRTGERSLIFVYAGDGVFEPREVQAGVVAGSNQIQITDGLKEGEAVVVSGQFLLDSETSIQEAVRKMRAAGVSDKSMPGGHQH